MKSSESELSLEVTKRMPGTPEAVFPYFIEPELLAAWQGTTVDIDPRPGGRYIVNYGSKVRIVGEYVEIDPPRKIVMLWGWDIEEPNAPLAGIPPKSTRVEFTFTQDGKETVILLRHTGLPGDEARLATRWGSETYLDRLAVVLSGDDPGPDPVDQMVSAQLGSKIGRADTTENEIERRVDDQ